MSVLAQKPLPLQLREKGKQVKAGAPLTPTFNLAPKLAFQMHTLICFIYYECVSGLREEAE